MRSFRALISASTILLLTLTALKARADDPYTFTLSATAPNSGSLTFSLSPDTPYMLPTSFGDFDYYNPPGFIEGAPTSFDAIDVTPYQGGESLFVGDDFFDFYALFDFSQQFLIGTPDGSQPVIVPGTYSGEVGCDVALRSPLATSQLPVTMALLQFQTPFTTECGKLSI